MFNSKIISDDINDILIDNNISWDKLRNKVILITGATGAIGYFIINVLGILNEEYDFNVKIYAIGRNKDKGMQLSIIKGVTFITADIRNFQYNFFNKINFIIHCAAITDSSKMLSTPIDVIDTELIGGKNILDLAKNNEVDGMVYTSSMEVYGNLNLSEIVETDMGYIDLKNPRNSYPQGKRMMECICNCYFSQYNIPINIARLGMTFGASMDFNKDKRVWAQFANCIYYHHPIILHTTGESIRSFVYLADAIKGIFLLLLYNNYGETYNIATKYLRIKDLAELLALNFNISVNIAPPEDINNKGYLSELMLPLSSNKIQNIGWKPTITSINEMFERTIEQYNQFKTIQSSN